MDGEVLSDRMVFSNAGGFLNICIQSTSDSPNQTDTCDPVGTITKLIYPGDPAIEVLRSPNIFDVPTGQIWFAQWTSQNIGGQSDSFLLQPVPEPGTLTLLGLGLFGLSRRLRRKV